MAKVYVAKVSGEWMETPTPIGVYSTKEKALDAILAYLTDVWELEPMEIDSETYSVKDYLEGLE